jgi:hypothetical protein
VEEAVGRTWWRAWAEEASAMAAIVAAAAVCVVAATAVDPPVWTWWANLLIFSQYLQNLREILVVNVL